MDGYDLTPGGAFRATFGGADYWTEQRDRWEADQPDREAAYLSYCERRGWTRGPDGHIRRRTTMPDGSGGMVSVDLDELAAVREYRMAGREIFDTRDIDLDAEERTAALEAYRVSKILGRMRAQAVAEQAMASAETTGPLDASAYYSAAQDRIMRGIG